MRVSAWLKRHDPDFAALRRAGRAAIVMPLLFAFGGVVIGSPDVATFAAFGSFAMLLLVDFGGPLIDRVQAQLGLAVAGAVLVCLGTLVSRPVWLSAVAMAVLSVTLRRTLPSRRPDHTEGYGSLLRSVLAGKGYDVTYNESDGTHSSYYWMLRLPDGLQATLGKSPRR